MTVSEVAGSGFQIPLPHQVFDFRTTDGAIVRLRQYGSLGKRRLALSHGNGLAINAYFPFWRLLLNEFELILFDLRNHGENPFHDPVPHTWERIACDMGEIWCGINSVFGTKPIIGVFHSLSALAALMNEFECGPRWDALALFDPPAFPRAGHALQEIEIEQRKKLARKAAGRPTSYSSPEEFARQLSRQAAFKRWVPGSYLEFARSTLRGDSVSWTLRCPRELESKIFSGDSDRFVWTQMDELAQPVILIGADPNSADAGTAAHICHAIYAEIGIRYAFVHDTTHFLQIEKPEDCCAILKKFIDDVLPSRG